MKVIFSSQLNSEIIELQKPGIVSIAFQQVFLVFPVRLIKGFNMFSFDWLILGRFI